MLVLVPGAGAGAGCGCRCWCCELAVHVVETGCWWWCWVPGAGWWWCCELAAQVVEIVRGAGAGVGAVSWLCAWWRQGAGAGAWRWCCELAARVVEAGCGRRCRCWVLAVRVGWHWCCDCACGLAGAVSWLCAWETGCRVPALQRCCELAVRLWCCRWVCELAVHVVETGCRVLGATGQPPLLTVKCQQSWAA